MRWTNSLQPFVAYPIRGLWPLVALMALGLISASPARAQTPTTIYRFCLSHDAACPNGNTPNALIQATDGNLYGTTLQGGIGGYGCDGFSDVGCGTAFKITPSGSLTTLYRFCLTKTCPDGIYPSSLVQATNGDFYGTTEWGSTGTACEVAIGCGAVFKLTPGGELTTLHTFCSQSNCADGSNPVAGLIVASNGDLYGTTGGGGANSDGTVFKMTPSGTLTTIYSFCAQPNCADGNGPVAGLVQASNGDLYGTAEAGGTNNKGTVFKITPGGQLTTLYDFCSQPACADGAYPAVTLVQATNGDLYGMTMEGGLNGNIACPSSSVYTGCGTVFKLTPGGALTTIYSFCSQPNCADGSVPIAGLIQATNGDLYGTTPLGAKGSGTLFSLSPDGQLTTLYRFNARSGSDSSDPVTPLLQATSGSLYGTTERGAIGSSIDGTVFSLNLGLGPFVALQTNSGQVGERVTILGTNLADASSVTFNGTPATFTVNSTGSAITATVPAEATSGAVEVTTPNGTLQSNQRFIII